MSDRPRRRVGHRERRRPACIFLGTVRVQCANAYRILCGICECRGYGSGNVGYTQFLEQLSQLRALSSVEGARRQAAGATWASAEFQGRLDDGTLRARSLPHPGPEVGPGPVHSDDSTLSLRVSSGLQQSPDLQVVLRPDGGQVRDIPRAAEQVSHHVQALVVDNGKTVTEALEPTQIDAAALGGDHFKATQRGSSASRATCWRDIL